MSRISSDEEAPFLPGNDAAHINDKTSWRREKPTKTSSYLNLIVYIALAISLFANVIILFKPEISSELKTPYTPAHHVIFQETKSIDTHESTSPFYSPPGPEFDEAWSDLLIPSTIRVTGDELRQAGKKSLKLQNEEGYLTYLEVYHQLHCVKRLVQIRYPERYPELVERGHLTEGHFNHCIEVLRKGIMCNADTTLNTYKWIQDGNETRIFGVSDAPKVCVDWKRLDDWARTRAPRPDYELMGPDDPGFLGP